MKVGSLSDQSGRPAPGSGWLVIRAVFVPDGEQPPPEFLNDIHSLHFPATRDAVTGNITCENGMDFFGGVHGEWYPDDAPDQSGGDQREQSDGGQPDGSGGGMETAASEASDPAEPRNPTGI
jgi:hypothetical protein